MNNKDLSLNLVIIFHFITVPFLLWLTYESEQSGNDKELMMFGIGAIMMFVIGYGLFSRVNTIRILTLVFTWLNLIIVGIQTFIGIPWVLLSSNMSLDTFEAITSFIAFIISAFIVKTLHSGYVRNQFSPNKAIKTDG